MLLEVDDKNVLGKTLPELLEKFDVTPAMDVVRTSAFRGKRIFNIITTTENGGPETIDQVRAATITPFPRDASTPRGFVVILSDRSDTWRTEQLKSRFIENVAHKLRTPLNAIQAKLSLLQQECGESSSSHAELLDEIDRNSTILCRIVDRFVEFAEDRTQNRSPITPDLVSLKETIHDVVVSMRDEAEAKGVELGLVGRVPLGDKFALTAKAEMFWWNSDTNVGGQSDSDSGNDFTYGVGVDWALNDMFVVTGAWQKYDISDVDVDLLVLGFRLRFGGSH